MQLKTTPRGVVQKLGAIFVILIIKYIIAFSVSLLNLFKKLMSGKFTNILQSKIHSKQTVLRIKSFFDRCPHNYQNMSLLLINTNTKTANLIYHNEAIYLFS